MSKDSKRVREVPRHPRPIHTAPHASQPHTSHRMDDADAFIPDPAETGRSRVSDDLAEALAEGYISSATSAESVAPEVRDEEAPEELGGPFVDLRAEEVFADDVDPSNPIDAEPAPFPTAMRIPDDE